MRTDTAASDGTDYAGRARQDDPRQSDRIRSLFENFRLTPTQRRIAQCLIEHPAQAPYLSSVDVARMASVSQPSVTRFAVAVGYSGYPKLRDRMRATSVDAPPESEADVRRNEWQRALNGEAGHLEALSREVSEPARIEQAAELFVASCPLVVMGLRASAPIANYFSYFAARIHPYVRTLDTGGTLTIDRLERARDAGGTAMLAVVFPRYPRETVAVLEAARDLGFKIVVLTDSPISPSVEFADVLLAAPVGSSLVFDSHVAPVALATLLLQAMCDADPAQSQRNLESFEQRAARRKLFVS